MTSPLSSSRPDCRVKARRYSTPVLHRRLALAQRRVAELEARLREIREARGGDLFVIGQSMAARLMKMGTGRALVEAWDEAARRCGGRRA